MPSVLVIDDERAVRQSMLQVLTRSGYVDLNALTEQVNDDVKIAEAWKKQP